METSNQRCWIVISFFLLAAAGSFLFLEISRSIIRQESILIIPTLNIQIESLHIIILLIYTLFVVKSSSNQVHWYFIPLVVFIIIQLFYSAWSLFNKANFIEFQLNACWDETYRSNNLLLLYEIQTEYHCKGFFDISDRSIPITPTSDPCFPALYDTFGNTIYWWGTSLFIVKIIQAMGLIFCFTLYHDAVIEEDEELDSKIEYVVFIE